MFRLRSWRTKDVQRKLERHLLIRPHAIEERDRSRYGLKIQEMNGIAEPIQKRLNARFVKICLTGNRNLALNLLVSAQIEKVRNLCQTLNAFCQQAKPFFPATIKV